MTDQFEEYKKRYKDWRDISVTQLSNTNNILLTVSSGLLVLALDKDEHVKPHFNFSQTVSFEVTTYWISIFLLFLSIIYGVGVLLTRLYDFRICRHIALTRQRFLKANENEKIKELSYDDFGDYSWTDRASTLWRIIFNKLPFLTRKEAKIILSNAQLKCKFESLRKTSDILGTATWRWTKIQIILFLLSGLIYLIHRTF